MAAARELLRALPRGDSFEGPVSDRGRRGASAPSDTGWVHAYDELLATALSLFRAGDFAVAASLWATLLPGLLEDRFGGIESPAALLEADLPQHLAAWCRALLSTRRAHHRCYAVATALHAAARLGLPLHVEAIRDAHPVPPEGWAEVHRGLRSALLQVPVDSPEWGELRARLIGGLPRAEGEIAELRSIAARAGRALPDLHLELIAGLVASDRAAEAREAAAAAERDAESWGSRALFADRLAALCWSTGAEGEAEARRRAWEAAPTADRLLRMAAAAEPEALRAALALAYEEEDDQHTLVQLEVLAGENEVALARLQGADPRHAADPEHPFAPVLAALMVLALGGEAPPAGGAIERAARLGFPRSERPTWSEREAEPASVLAAVAARHPGWRADAAWFRAQAHHELIRGADGTVSFGQDYARVAQFAAAWSEAAAAAGEPDEARAFPVALARRFPRRRAFRAALEAAMTTVVWPD